MVRNCPQCAERLPSHQPDPLLPTPRPSRPFESVAVDLFHFAGSEYLLMTDIFSGWPVVGRLGSGATSTAVINRLKDWMTDKGIAVNLTSDGGPQFTSALFREFCEQWGINHVRSSPHHHQGNAGSAQLHHHHFPGYSRTFLQYFPGLFQDFILQSRALYACVCVCMLAPHLYY